MFAYEWCISKKHNAKFREYFFYLVYAFFTANQNPFSWKNSALDKTSDEKSFPLV